MKLTDIAIRRTKPSDKPIKLNDGNGLFLSVQKWLGLFEQNNPDR